MGSLVVGALALISEGPVFDFWHHQKFVAYVFVKSIKPKVLWFIASNYHEYRDLHIFPLPLVHKGGDLQ